MKKQYKKPSAEVVNSRLLGSILDNPNTPVGDWSKFTLDGDAKENNLDFEEGFGDIWGDAGDTGNPYDIWGE